MALALPCRLRGASWRRRRRQKWPRVVAPGAARAYVRDARGRDKRGRSVPRQADARPGPRTATEGFQLAPGGAATRQGVCVCCGFCIIGQRRVVRTPRARLRQEKKKKRDLDFVASASETHRRPAGWTRVLDLRGRRPCSCSSELFELSTFRTKHAGPTEKLLVSSLAGPLEIIAGAPTRPQDYKRRGRRTEHQYHAAVNADP